MLTNVYTKAASDRWLGMAIGSLTLVSFLALGMAVYNDIDLDIYRSLPEAFQAIVGIDEGFDAAALAYSAMYSSYGALTIFSLALAMGGAAIAGEERKGTMGLLLGNPLSRTSVLVAKAAALVTLVALAIAVLWIGGLAIPAVMDVNVEGQDVSALLVHMFAGALFFGFLALAIGAWTGKNGAATGITAGVMVLSFFAVGFLPMFEGLADLAKVFPWYYYNGSDPLANGIDIGNLVVLLGATALLAVLAVVGVNRRDLRGRSLGTTMVDRLRSAPITRVVVERLAGSARVSRIWLKTASDYQGLLLVVGSLMFLVMGVMIGAMWPALDSALVSLGDAIPAEMMALFGGGDMSTAAGYLQAETFGMMAPIAIMILTILIGARAVAGEEADRTIGLLLANPVSRSRVLGEKAFVMVLYGAAVGAITFAGVAIGDWIGGMGIGAGNIAAASLGVTLLGLVFGGVALLVGAATGNVRVAVWLAVGLALFSHVANAYLPFSDSLAGLAKLTPNYYYLTSDPLNNGLDVGHTLVLLVLSAALIAASYPLFNRRDLRSRG